MTERGNERKAIGTGDDTKDLPLWSRPLRRYPTPEPYSLSMFPESLSFYVFFFRYVVLLFF